MLSLRCAVTIAATCVVSCTAPNPAPSPRNLSPPETHLSHYIPYDLNVVGSADLVQARKVSVDEDIVAYLKAGQVSAQVIEALGQCIVKGQRLWAGLRVSRTGFEGDSVVVITGLKDHKGCTGSGWRLLRSHGALEYWERSEGDSGRSSPALMLTSPDGVLVATTAEVDPVLRVLREGPDADRLEPGSDATVNVAARLGEGSIPDGLRGKAPVLSDLVRHLAHARMALDVTEAAVGVKVALTYTTGTDAQLAGEVTKKLRLALMDSDRRDYREAARSAHANLVDEVVRVRFSVPRASGQAP